MRTISGVVAQAWRDGARQARVPRLPADAAVDVVVLDELSARAVGLLCRRGGHADVVDVQVALVARERDATVMTSDPSDFGAVDPSLAVIEV